MGSIVLFAAGTIAIYMSLWYIIALLQKRNDVADIAWGLGFVVLSYALLWQTGNMTNKAYIVTLLVTIWGVRLATHIGLRHRGKPEDGRYQAMRKSWRLPRLQAYTNVFLLQGFFMLLVASPIMVIMRDIESTLVWYNWLGIGIWLIGFIFEAVGDYQLTKFVNNGKNQGKIMRYGLWRYSRHPNYFGEITQWWAIFLIVPLTDHWYVAILGPVTISFLILGVSGIPMLEKRYKGNKEYENYQRTTSSFFPALPKQ